MIRHLRAAVAALLLLVLWTAGAHATANGAIGCTGVSNNFQNVTCPDINEELTNANNRGIIRLGSVSGTNTITANAAPYALTSYQDGQHFTIKPAAGNTGAVTLNINSLGAKAIVKQSGSALASGDLASSTIYTLSYYASDDHFRVMGAVGTPGVDDDVPEAGDYTNLTGGTGITNSPTGTINFDATEINSATWGAGSFTAFTFNAGAVDPVMTMGSGTVTWSATTTFSLDDEAEFRLLEEDANGSNYIGFKPPAAITSNVTCTLENDSTPFDTCVSGVSDGDKGDVTITGGVWAIDANAVALTTDTTGNYAAGDAEAGAALTGDSATGFFSTGMIEVARGGNGAAPGADDQTFVSSSTSAGAWASIPDSDGATQKLQYDVTTNAFSAGTDDDVPEVGDFAALVGGSGIDNNSGTLDLDLTELSGAITIGAGSFTDLIFNSSGTADPSLSLSAAQVLLYTADGTSPLFSLDDQGELRFREEDAGGNNYIGFKAPAAITSDVTCTLENDSSPIPDSCVGDGVDGGGGLADADYGDITVSGSGTVMNIDADTVGEPELDLITGNTATNGDCLVARPAGSGGTLEFAACPGAGGGISNVEEDLSPTLGGNLALGGFDISGTGNVNVTGDLQASDDVIVGDDLTFATGAVINWNAGDVTLTHSADTLTVAGGTVVLPNAGLQLGASVPFSDSAGTLTLQNVDAVDATTEGTIEAAIDTAANLTSIQGHTVTLTGALIRSGAHSLTMTTTGTTTVTLPTSGTLATTTDVTNKSESFCVFASDQSTSVTTGTNKVIFGIPFAMTLTGVSAFVNTAPTGSTIIIDINEDPDAEGGSASATILSTKLSIDVSERRSSTATSAAVISDTALAANAEMSIDFDQVGSSTPGKGVQVCLEGHR